MATAQASQVDGAEASGEGAAQAPQDRKRARAREYLDCNFRDAEGVDCECPSFCQQQEGLECSSCKHKRGFHAADEGLPEHGVTKCLHSNCRCLEYDKEPGGPSVCVNCRHSIRKHTKVLFWVMGFGTKMHFRHGTSRNQVRRAFECAGHRPDLELLAFEDGTLVPVGEDLTGGYTYTLQGGPVFSGQPPMMHTPSSFLRRMSQMGRPEELATLIPDAWREKVDRFLERVRSAESREHLNSLPLTELKNEGNHGLKTAAYERLKEILEHLMTYLPVGFPPLLLKREPTLALGISVQGNRTMEGRIDLVALDPDWELARSWKSALTWAEMKGTSKGPQPAEKDYTAQNLSRGGSVFCARRDSGEGGTQELLCIGTDSRNASFLRYSMHLAQELSRGYWEKTKLYKLFGDDGVLMVNGEGCRELLYVLLRTSEVMKCREEQRLQLAAAAEPQDWEPGRDGEGERVPGALRIAARDVATGSLSGGAGGVCLAGAEAAEVSSGARRMTEVAITGVFDVGGALAEAFRGLVVAPVFTSGDLAVVRDDQGGVQTFQVDGPPLSQSSRGAVYAVRSLDAPGTPAAILRHGQWTEGGSMFVEAHTVALERLQGVHGHPRVICKGVVDQPGGGEGGRATALAVVESHEGTSVQPGSLDKYGVSQLGASLCAQLAVQSQCGILQRDLTLDNVLVRAKRSPRPPRSPNPLLRSVSVADSAQTSRSSDEGFLSLHSLSSSGASSGVCSPTRPRQTHPSPSPTSPLQTTPAPRPDLSNEFEGLTFTNCDFDLAGVVGVTERFGFRYTNTPIVKNSYFQPHALFVEYLTAGDVALTLALVMATAYSGMGALPWADKAAAADEHAVHAELQRALTDPWQLFGLGEVHPLVGQFVREAKAAVQSDAHWERWSASLQKAADELSIQRASPGKGSRSPSPRKQVEGRPL